MVQFNFVLFNEFRQTQSFTKFNTGTLIKSYALHRNQSMDRFKNPQITSLKTKIIFFPLWRQKERKRLAHNDNSNFFLFY